MSDGMDSAAAPLTITVASALEPEQIEAIRASEPSRYRVLYDPALVPVPQFPSDHAGPPFEMTGEQRQRWAGMLAAADIMFDFDWVEPERLPMNAPRLRWVQSTSTGVGDFLSATGLVGAPFIVTTASGVQARPLAEFTILALLHFFRDMPALERARQARQWQRHAMRGFEGARVLVVGMGSIGSEVSRQVASLGGEVIGLRRGDRPAPPGVSRMIARADLRETLATCDALVLCCPLTSETRGIIGAAELASVRPGLVLVNVARGALVDEAALVRTLRDGRIGGAALDAFVTEPLPPESPFWEMPNVIITPHSASVVPAENQRIVEIFIDNLGRYARQQPLRNVFEPERGY